MKVLMICNKSPFPAKEGGPIAMNAIAEGLIDAGHSLKILAINTNKYAIPLEDIPADYRKKTGIELGYIDLSIKPIDAFLNLFTSKSYHVERFINKDFENKILKILEIEKFDIIQFETLFITPYLDTIRKHSDAKIVLRAHNIEHLIWQRVAESTRNPLKKFYLNHLAKTLKAYELNAINKFDGIATITQKDSAFFSQNSQTPIIPISFGINPDNIKVLDTEYEFPSLFHIGAMNWIPNIEGIKWFLENVWEDVHKEFPELKFYLAGREMPDWLYQANYPNVEVIGEVEDAWEFIGSKATMVVPLLSGSGIRIKIIEGMASAKAIISTRIGAEGINCTHGENILLAETKKDFIEAIRTSVNSKEKTIEIGHNARKLIEEDHNNKKIIERLVAFYKEIL